MSRFYLDRETRSVNYEGKSLYLQPKLYAVMALLIEQAGEVVTYEDFRHAVKDWHEWTLAEVRDVLHTYVNRIRAALGPASVITLRDVGYSIDDPEAVRCPECGRV